MKIHSRKPAAALDRFVQSLFIFEGDPQPHSKERALPDGCALLVINLDEDRTRLYNRYDFSLRQSFNGCALVGPQIEFNVIETQRNRLAGIHFKPGGAYPFVAPPVDELRGEQLPLDTVWGGFASELRERLLEASTPDEQISIMEGALLARARPGLERHPAVEFALQQLRIGPQTKTIADVTDKIGLSSRRFIELFRREVGLTPKLFCRVQRFQRALRRFAAGKAIDWTDVALDAGYFDQAHFIHDFREFSGINPSTYADAHSRFANHVPLPD